MRRLYRVEVVGAEHIPAAAAASSPRTTSRSSTRSSSPSSRRATIRYMAKAELLRTAPSAAALRSLGAFPVERGGGDQAAFSEAAELLRGGEVLGIFPQGTSKQHRDRRWHRGAARLALATGAPIVPVRMTARAGSRSAEACGSRSVRADSRRARAAERRGGEGADASRSSAQCSSRDRPSLAALADRLGAAALLLLALYLRQRRTRNATPSTPAGPRASS